MGPPLLPSTSWVILSREVYACGDGDGGGGGIPLPEGADLALELAAPPRVSKLAVSRRITPAKVSPFAKWKSFVIAIDPSAGLVLLLAPPPPGPGPGELRSFTDADGKVHTYHVTTMPTQRYFVCDIAARTAYYLPDPEGCVFNNDLSIIAAPGGGGKYLVVEFKFIVGGDKATLLCFSSETGLWEKKPVNNPLPRWIWRCFDVGSYAGKLYWVDTAAGLLFCDPFVDEPHMEYVPLPRVELPPEHDEDCHGCDYCAERAFVSRRCVRLSDGKFREAGTKVWTLEYAVSFADLWASESYKAAGLPEKAPVLALVHPKNPDVVYFFVEDQLVGEENLRLSFSRERKTSVSPNFLPLVGVDLRAKEVLEYETHKMTVPENARVFPYGLLPMVLPPALSAGLSKEGATSACDNQLDVGILDLSNVRILEFSSPAS
ncbi:hypothetical protein [Oryza sativa Japonica Group]|uniref:DUF1618 domain-containing protein n=1 Tax=Oryza sativa subsp. japonica TaxID=39947 RepID=Q5NA65_ORYSJ|nr:hypothetical protein [Oryza sativa Japonica Group]